MSLRAVTSEDASRIGEIAEAAGLFPAEMVPDLLGASLGGDGTAFFVLEQESVVVGFAYARPEELTDRTWNVLALGVATEFQGKGLGRDLLAQTEAALEDAWLFIIETTQLPEQEAARALYESAGYVQHAQIPDFFGDGEDKVVFGKRGGGAA